MCIYCVFAHIVFLYTNLWHTVKCLGTEDRVTDPAKKVPPSSDIVPFVTFPGQDIKDLIVHDPNSPPPVPEPHTVGEAGRRGPARNAPPKAPAQQQQHQQNNHNQHGGGRGGRGGRGGGRRDNRYEGGRGGGDSGGGGAAGTGAHLLKMREKKAHEGGDASGKDISSAGEFDFEAGLNVFKKDDILAKVAKEATPDVAPAEISYKKDDFFDSLSCDMADREAGRKTRMSASEERNLNQDTFGAIALQNNNYRRWHGRGGRGRGTGSGWRGGGGGGRGYGGRGGGRGRGGGGGQRQHYSYNNHSNTTHDGSGRIQQPAK